MFNHFFLGLAFWTHPIVSLPTEDLLPFKVSLLFYLSFNYTCLSVLLQAFLKEEDKNQHMIDLDKPYEDSKDLQLSCGVFTLEVSCDVSVVTKKC